MAYPSRIKNQFISTNKIKKMTIHVTYNFGLCFFILIFSTMHEITLSKSLKVIWERKWKGWPVTWEYPDQWSSQDRWSDPSSWWTKTNQTDWTFTTAIDQWKIEYHSVFYVVNMLCSEYILLRVYLSIFCYLIFVISIFFNYSSNDFYDICDPIYLSNWCFPSMLWPSLVTCSQFTAF